IGDLIEGLGDVAVVADGIDYRACDRELTRLESGDLELPQQVLLQRLARRVGVFLLTLVIVAAAPGSLRGTDILLAPAFVQYLDRAFLRALRSWRGLVLGNRRLFHSL